MPEFNFLIHNILLRVPAVIYYILDSGFWYKLKYYVTLLTVKFTSMLKSANLFEQSAVINDEKKDSDCR